MLSEGPRGGSPDRDVGDSAGREGKGRGGSRILLARRPRGRRSGEEVKLSHLADSQGKKKLPENEG